MSIESIASRLGRKDEEPNIKLAEELARAEDRSAIDEIAAGAAGTDPRTASDCIKVLYEIGYRKPGLIAGYADLFVGFLRSPNNRLVWGAMTAISLIAGLRPQMLFEHRAVLIRAYENGSVITRDAAVSVFAHLAKSSPAHEEFFLPIILKHLETCRPKETAQHAERAVVCASHANADRFTKVLTARIDSLTEPQKKRVNRVLESLRRIKLDTDPPLRTETDGMPKANCADP